MDFDTIIYLLSFAAFVPYVLDKCKLVNILAPIFTVAIYLIQPYGILKKTNSCASSWSSCISLQAVLARCLSKSRHSAGMDAR